MTENRRDLSALSTPPRRGAGLAGGLPPRGSAPSAPESTETQDEETTGDSAEERSKRARKQPMSRAPTSSGRKKPWTVYIPVDVADEVEQALDGKPWTAWVLDAYRHVHARLTERFVPAEADDSGLPTRPMGARRDVDHPREKQLRLTDAEIRVLESKMESLGGPTRSAFITAVVELRLEQLR